jgi:hypothetical protein
MVVSARKQSVLSGCSAQLADDRFGGDLSSGLLVVPILCASDVITTQCEHVWHRVRVRVYESRVAGTHSSDGGGAGAC